MKSYRSLVQSQPDLSAAALAAGVVAVEPDADGVVRRLALAVAYRQTIVPSFALEVVRIGGGEPAIVIDTGPLGIERIRIGGTTIPTDRRGRAIIHFAPPLARYISASDVLDPAFDPAQLRGQVILLGVTGIGVAGLRETPLGLVRAVDLHAELIESAGAKFEGAKPWLAKVDHFEMFDSPTEELARLEVRELIGAYYRQIGVVWNGGKSLVPAIGR